jgi:leucyl/phenylalanyl-tRNA--protein transferase
MSERGLRVDLADLYGRYPFPDPGSATPDGLVAYGGDLSPGRLISAYASGIFPWYQSGPVLWFSPDPRMALRPAHIHVGRSLRRTLARSPFELRMDTAFDAVIRACAEVPRPDQDGTWITADMVAAYGELHRLGLAHSVEAWRGGELVGGLYGVSLGAVFFGESMFARESDASKVAFVALARQLESWGFTLIDCQVHTEHLERFGAVLWSRSRFLRELAAALERPTRAGPWGFEDSAQSRPRSGLSNHSTSQ